MLRLSHDLRGAGRALLASPRYAAAVVLILALSQGAATMAFSLVDGLLLRPLAVRDQQQLVRVWKDDRERGFAHFPLIYPELREWARRSTTLEGVAAEYWTPWTVTLATAPEPFRVRVLPVDAHYSDVLGVTPMLGRAFTAADERSTALPPVLISHALWTRTFGADPAVVGTVIPLRVRQHAAFAVVGVLPRTFDLGGAVDAWVPLLALNVETPDDRVCECDAVARLKPHVTVEQARAELQTIHAAVARTATGPQARELRVVVTPLLDTVAGASGPAAQLLLAAAGLLLLTAGVNLAGLAVARAAARRRDLAIRKALGATRGRLVREQVAESLLLSFGGLVGALIVGAAGLDALLRLKGADLPRAADVTLDLRAVAFSVVVLAVLHLLYGLGPALRSATVDPAEALRQRTPSPADQRLMTLTVGAEVALAVVLLVAAGLLTASWQAQRGIDRGVAVSELLSVGVSLPETRYAEPAARLRIVETLAEELRQLPGVSATSPLMLPPGTGRSGHSAPFIFDGQSPDEARQNPMATFEWAAPQFFQTMGIPLLQGRVFDATDGEGSERVAIVSAETAATYWPGQDPLGRWVGAAGFRHRVVGVVADTRYRELTRTWHHVYFPMRQNPFGESPAVLFFAVPGRIAVRTHGDLQALIPAIRAAVRRVDSEIPLDDIAVLETLLDRELAAPRFNAVLVLAFTGLSVLLAVAGAYAVAAAFVNRRLHEFGLRLALGATPGRLRAAVLARGISLAGVGAAAGLLLAWLLSSVLEQFLFGVASTDGAVFAGAAVLAMAAAIVATLLPAVAAGRASPAVLLRRE